MVWGRCDVILKRRAKFEKQIYFYKKGLQGSSRPSLDRSATNAKRRPAVLLWKSKSIIEFQPGAAANNTNYI